MPLRRRVPRRVEASRRRDWRITRDHMRCLLDGHVGIHLPDEPRRTEELKATWEIMGDDIWAAWRGELEGPMPWLTPHEQMVAEIVFGVHRKLHGGKSPDSRPWGAWQFGEAGQ